MNFEEMINWLKQYTGGNLWILQVFIIVFLALVTNFFAKRLLNRLRQHAEKTKTYWDDTLIGAIDRPLTLLIWILGVAFAIEIIKEETDATIFKLVDPIRDIGVIGTITWFLVRFAKGVENSVVSKKKRAGEEYDPTTIDAIGKLVRISVIITGVLVSMQTLGYSISGVLAFGGIGGLAVGFAAKDILANFFGGLMIYLDRPFAPGDWIRSPDRQIEGTVEKIGWRLTVIRTFDKRPLYVPNSNFTSITVENPSRMTNRRIYETIGIRYRDINKMAGIITDVKQMLVDHPDIDDTLTMMVNFNSFAPSSLDFFVYTFTHTTVWTEFHQIKQDILFRISEIIYKHGAEVAFPTSTVHLAAPGPEVSTDK